MTLIQELSQRDLLHLLETVCQRHHVTQKEVCGRNRTRMVSLARQELWWLLRNHSDLKFSYVELGRLFSRNHSTVLQGVRAWDKVLSRRLRVHPSYEEQPMLKAA